MAQHALGERLALTGKEGGRRIRLFFLSAGFDLTFLAILFLILSIGIVTMFSASYAYAYYYRDGNSSFFILRQLIAAGIGLAAMFGLSMLDYHLYYRFWWLLYAVSVGLLVVVLFTHSESGIHRWISLPVFGQFQPSEIGKLAAIMAVASLIAANYRQMDKMKTTLLAILPAVVLCGLIVIEPHFSGTILIVAITAILLIVGGARWRNLLLIGAVAVAFAAAFILLRGYETDRLEVWLDPMKVFTSDQLYDGMTGRDVAWQTVQSLYAIGSGGLMGAGLGNSRQKHLFLPEPQNDFVFAIVCEELGFIGAVVIILLFALLVWRGLRIALYAKDKFGSLLALGIIAQIGLQVGLNIAVVSNLVPNTGISLPFFSYGGTSLVVLLAQMGILLSVSRQGSQAERKPLRGR